MKIAIIVSVTVIMLVGETGSFFIENGNTKMPPVQKTLLRKLQNLQQNEDTDPSTWNDVLADVLVNKIKIFSSNNFDKDTQNDIVETSKENIATKCFSQIFWLYKRFVYDKFVKIDISDFNTNNTINDIDSSTDVPVPVSEKRDIDENGDPKTEVELINPQYHGKIEAVDGSECAEGLERDEDGNCVNSNSKFILYIPSQCPMGYRKDQLGVCRILF